MNKVEAAVEAHAQKIKQVIEKFGAQHFMTVLIGSQNYGLDSKDSDIDTFSFVMPSLNDLITGKPPLSFEMDTDDGKCSVKDYRLAFNLLRKPSPNSVECFNVLYPNINTMSQNIVEF